ncbi:MAG: SUMF1/EgtB/PvdO family nonheme iron enzyme [Bradymonadales bacterium]
MFEPIYFEQRKPAISVFYFLFMTLFLILSCETGEALNFTPGQESVCPPRDARCCPDDMDECSLDEMREAGKCEMGSELDYGVKKGRCTHEKVCRPVGVNNEVFVFACRERCTEVQNACLDNNNDAACIDVMRDNDNCGGCFYDGTGNRCAKGVSCTDGYCRLICPSPQTSCGGVCINPQSDNENCGGCAAEGKGEKCMSGLRCSNGECATECAEGYVPCGEACINPNNDPLHCGACSLIGQDNKCDDGYQCINAECKPFCAEACQNGGTCIAPNTCDCKTGWSGNTCTTPVCNPICQNGGTCSAPNTCSCPISWIGRDCSKQDRVRIPISGSSTTFTMGRPGTDTWGHSNETPSHEVTLNAYMMDRYLVTAASYKHCVDAGSCTEPYTKDKCATYGTYSVKGKENHPINCVNWSQAKSYCEWAGGRLPTEAEWERAAKGKTHHRFPWGDDCPSAWNDVCSGAEWTALTAKANCLESKCLDEFEYTSPVDQFPSGKSPDGLYDMAGNLYEWTCDGWGREYTSVAVTNPTGSDSGKARVVRGGGLNSEGSHLRVYRREVQYGDRASYYGFRCASSAP